MSVKTLGNWIHKARQAEVSAVGDSRKPVTELETEVCRLKRALAEARAERDMRNSQMLCMGPGQAAILSESSHKSS